MLCKGQNLAFHNSTGAKLYRYYIFNICQQETLQNNKEIHLAIMYISFYNKTLF